jgi:hypothetical protein
MERLTVFDGEFWIHKNFPPVEEDRVDEFIDCVKELAARLAAIEDILGDEYDLDKLMELVQAKRKGRCIVLPCKKGDTVWRIVHDAAPHITKDRCTDIKYENRDIWVHLIGDRVMGGWNFGKLLFLTREDAEAALRREQDG